MPYAVDHIGIYKIVNTATNVCYVGQSQWVKKRIKEHFRLLGHNRHPNPKLQHAYNKYGRSAFTWSLEVECADVADLDMIENAFISGEAVFVEPVFYNIADFAKAPMRNNKHSEEVRKRISAGRRATTFDYKSDTYRKTLSEAQHHRNFSDFNFVANLKFILDNPDMSYAERGRRLGKDTSSVRRLALKYSHLKGAI